MLRALSKWFDTKWAHRPKARKAKPARPSIGLGVEVLEERLVPTGITWDWNPITVPSGGVYRIGDLNNWNLGSTVTGVSHY